MHFPCFLFCPLTYQQDVCGLSQHLSCCSQSPFSSSYCSVLEFNLHSTLQDPVLSSLPINSPFSITVSNSPYSMSRLIFSASRIYPRVKGSGSRDDQPSLLDSCDYDTKAREKTGMVATQSRRSISCPATPRKRACSLPPHPHNPPWMAELATSTHTFLLSPLGLAVVAIGTPALWMAYRAFVYLSSPYFSPLKKVNGPSSQSYVLGHFADLVNGNAYQTLRAYTEQYGKVFVIKAIFGVRKFL